MTIQEYQSKPTTTKAVEWDGTEAMFRGDVATLIGVDSVRPQKHHMATLAGGSTKHRRVIATYSSGILRLLTVDGNWVTVNRGTFVMVDASGYGYPCHPEVFASRWEPAEPDVWPSVKIPPAVSMVAHMLASKFELGESLDGMDNSAALCALTVLGRYEELMGEQG